MLDNEPDTNTNDNTGGETPATAPPPRRRRAASRPAGPPAATPPSMVVSSPVAQGHPVDTNPGHQSTSEPEGSTPAQPGTPQGAPADGTASAAEQVPAKTAAKKAPAKRAPRKAAPRKAVKAPDEQPTLDAAEGEAPAPRTRAPRKRAAKKTAAVPTGETSTAAVPEPVVAADLLTPVESPVADADVIEAPVVEPVGVEDALAAPDEEAPVETAADTEIALDDTEVTPVADVAVAEVASGPTTTQTEPLADAAGETSPDDELTARTKRLWADPFSVPEITPRAVTPADAGSGDAVPEDATSDDATPRADDSSHGDESSDDDDESGDDSSDGQSHRDDDGAPRRRRRRRGGRRHRRSGTDDDASNDSGSSDDSSDFDQDSSDDNASTAGPGTDGDDAPRGGGRSVSAQDSTSGRRNTRTRNAAKTDDAPADDTQRDENRRDDVARDENQQDESTPDTRGDRANEDATDSDDEDSSGQGRRRRRRRRRGEDSGAAVDDPSEVVVRVREPRARKKPASETEVTGITGSTRMEAKRQRRREGREAGRRRAPILSEAEFLARRESVNRTMVIRQHEDLSQIAVIEDDILVEHYVDRDSATSLIGNVYLGRVQNVLPSMEAAFIDIGRGRNAVLYAGEVDWDSFGAEGHNRKVEKVLKSGQTILVQVSKDPVGAKGARLTNHVSIPGRYIVYAPGGHLSGISRKLPENERRRLKDILHDLVGESASVIVRTAAEGASEEELVRDVNRLKAQWEDIEGKIKAGSAPQLLYGEPDLTVRIVRDLFTEDFSDLLIQGNGLSNDAYEAVQGYVSHVAPHLADRMRLWNAEENGDIFTAHRLDEQIAKGLERKVFLPSGGSLIIERTEAMTVIDVNTGKFTGTGGNLEATVTSNNLEAAEEIVRQLRLRDIGGIIVIDFIDMVLPNNRELLIRRLVECLGRDRTRHQVAEVTSLGLVQMTRKKIGTGLLEAFSTECEHCHGRGVELHDMPVETQKQADGGARDQRLGDRRGARPTPGNSNGGGNQGGGDQGGGTPNGGGSQGNRGGDSGGAGNQGNDNRANGNGGQSGSSRSGGRQGSSGGGRGRGGRPGRDQDGNDRTDSQDQVLDGQSDHVEIPAIQTQHVESSPMESQHIEASVAEPQHVEAAPVESQPEVHPHDDSASGSGLSAPTSGTTVLHDGGAEGEDSDGEQPARSSRRGRRGRGAARREQGAPNPSS